MFTGVEIHHMKGKVPERKPKDLKDRGGPEGVKVVLLVRREHSVLKLT